MGNEPRRNSQPPNALHHAVTTAEGTSSLVTGAEGVRPLGGANTRVVCFDASITKWRVKVGLFSPPSTTVAWRWYKKAGNTLQQAAELCAAIIAVRFVRQYRGSVLLLGDNHGATQAVNSPKIALHTALRNKLAKTRAIQRLSAKPSISAAWIPSKMNPADSPSRAQHVGIQKLPHSHQTVQTWYRLKESSDMWIVKPNTAGKGGTPRHVQPPSVPLTR